MELNRIREGISFLSGPTNLGVIETDGGVILIDSGMDDDTARRALNLLEKKVRAVIKLNAGWKRKN
ncbi:MAG: MBL fold metallo-hydrolase [Candidatus Thermoplasmatota archaeon]|nr:MBL fold metallo-hydrolase [Candidatus Thermoplasmatota archaeon]